MNELMNENLDDKIDQLEVFMESGRKMTFPLNHQFIEGIDGKSGMYIREILMEKSEEPEITLVTSLVHNTVHPYCVLSGKVAVISENDGEQVLEAGYRGTTIPNTRRVLKILETCRWVTFHVTDIMPKDDSEESLMEAVRLVEESILLPYENKLVGGHYKNTVFISSEKLMENADVNLLRYD